MKFCMRCGKQCDEGALICPACGQQFAGGMPVTNNIHAVNLSFVDSIKRRGKSEFQYKKFLILAVVIVVIVAGIGIGTKKDGVIGTWEMTYYSSYYGRNETFIAKIEKNQLTVLISDETKYYPVKIRKDEIEIDTTTGLEWGNLWKYTIDGDAIIVEIHGEDRDGQQYQVNITGVRVN